MTQDVPPPAPSAARSFVLGAILVALAVAVYLPLRDAGWIWDDDAFITMNPRIHAPDGLRRLWFTTESPDYFPLTSSMLWVEWRLFGGEPFGFHVVNVLLHAASAVFLWRALRFLGVPGAWFAAAVFAVHPVNAESVAWITERKNTLSMFFASASFMAWAGREDGRPRSWQVASVACFVASLLAKTASVTLPVAMLCVVWARRGRIARADVVRTAPHFAASLVLGLVTVWFQSQRSIADEVIRTDGFAARLAGAARAFWFYLGKTIVPWDLSFVYPRWTIDPSAWLTWVPLAAIVAAAAFAWTRRATWGRPVLAAGAAFGALLLPVAGFLDIYFMRYSLVADHWQYFAMVAPVVLACAASTRLVARHGALADLAPAAGALVIGGLGALTWTRCAVYRDTETLWTDTVARNPGSSAAQNNLGVAIFAKNRIEESIPFFEKAIELDAKNANAVGNLGRAKLAQGDADAAESLLRRAIEMAPRYAEAHYNLGIAVAGRGRITEAIPLFRQAIELSPEYAEARNNLAGALLQTGRGDEAIAEYREALRLRPGFLQARSNLGVALLRSGDLRGAADEFRTVLASEPDYPLVHLNLGTALGRLGDPEGAIRHFNRTLDLQKGSRPAMRGIAWVLATTPDPRRRDAKESLRIAEMLDQETGARDVGNIDLLAAALAENGRFEEAAIVADRAVAIASEQGQAAVAARIAARRDLYRAGRPFREPETPVR